MAAGALCPGRLFAPGRHAAGPRGRSAIIAAARRRVAPRRSAEARPLSNEQDVTRLLSAAQAGGPDARERLFAAVYAELRAMARARMARERPGQTLQATALVHEVYLKLVDARTPWQNRRHFFGAAAEAMRRLLIDQARRKQRLRHGGELERAEFEEAEETAVESGLPPEELLALDRALDELAAYDARKAEVVKLRYFAGLEITEVAEALEVSPATVKNDWTFARAWLKERLARGAE